MRRDRWASAPGRTVLAWSFCGLLLGCAAGERAYEWEETDGFYRMSRQGVSLRIQRAPFGWSLERGGQVILSTPVPERSAEFAATAFVQKDGPVSVATVVHQDSQARSASFEMRDATGQAQATWTVEWVEDGILRLELEPASTQWDSYGYSFDLGPAGHLYGQGELTDVLLPEAIPTLQHFPLDAGGYERPRLTTGEGSNVVTPLWLTASGAGIFHDSYSYLAVSLNRDGNRALRVHLLPEAGERRFSLHLLVAEHTRAVYEKWVALRWKHRPALPILRRPEDLVFTRPVWTTWAMYKTAIDRAKVLAFADEILAHGYDVGYLEIDDQWTSVYGDLDFGRDFPDARGLIGALHGKGMRVSAWVPPFVMQNARNFAEGAERGAFLQGEGQAYPARVGWWNTANVPSAAAVDFTSEAGRSFWGEKVDWVKDTYGLDGFKFDAGECQFLPADPILGQAIHPNSYPDHYARWATQHAGVEIRAGYFAQDLPIPLRQFDKNSVWGLNNGLAAVLTQYLALGLIGYPWVLPDMIGGNEYGQPADDELFIRWVELNAFLPMVQFSITPWRAGFSADVQRISLQMMQRRKQLDDYLLELADEAARTHLPLVRPLFFEFPADPMTYGLGDQYMLGPRYLVAPVLQKGARARTLYLPAGKWAALDNPGEIHEGPLTLEAYPAPLDRIPVFERLTPGG